MAAAYPGQMRGPAAEPTGTLLSGDPPGTGAGNGVTAQVEPGSSLRATSLSPSCWVSGASLVSFMGWCPSEERGMPSVTCSHGAPPTPPPACLGL